MAKNIYLTLKLWASLSPKLAQDTSSHHPTKDDSHVYQPQGDASGEKVISDTMSQVHHSSGDIGSSLSS